VSIGSLYQYFPHKEALLDALVTRYLEELEWEVFIQEEDLPITMRIDGLIDRLVRFHASHAGFRALFLETNVEQSIQSVVVQLTQTLLAQSVPALTADLRRQTALAWLGITRGIMQLTEPPHIVPESTTRSEIKLALVAYLRAVLVRAGVPLPEDLA
jgi:AcrR family transcriptional regulator